MDDFTQVQPWSVSKGRQDHLKRHACHTIIYFIHGTWRREEKCCDLRWRDFDIYFVLTWCYVTLSQNFVKDRSSKNPCNQKTLCKALFINTSLIRQLYKGVMKRERERKKENLKDTKSAQSIDVKNLSISTTDHL